MKNRGKLGNDGKVKFMGPGKVWDRERKLVGLWYMEITFLIAIFQFLFNFPDNQTRPIENVRSFHFKFFVRLLKVLRR